MTVAALEASTPLRKFLRPVVAGFVPSDFVVLSAKMCLLGGWVVNSVCVVYRVLGYLCSQRVCVPGGVAQVIPYKSKAISATHTTIAKE
jgi:hypothetical protein